MANIIVQTLRVQKDAELRDVAGKQVARVWATASQGKDKSGEWKPSLAFDVEAWSSNPWSFNDLSTLKKGQYIVAQGRLSMREYDGKEGKVQAYTIEADRIDVLAERQPQGQRPPQANGRSYSSDGGRPSGQAQPGGGYYAKPGAAPDAEDEDPLPF